MLLSSTNRKPLSTLQVHLLQPLMHIGFALTGVGTVLLGCILPRVAGQWHLRDKDAGLMLLVQFATSATGALLARRNLWHTLACGYALGAVGAIAIFLLQRSVFPFFLAAFGIFGLGLGLAMTSTNMLVGRHFTARRGAALALLNFAWSAGAVACPLVVARFFSHTSGGTLFGLTGVLLAPCALLPLLRRPGEWSSPTDTRFAPSTPAETPTIVHFALLAFLYVGVEATVGNWISTYATRAAAWSLTGSSVAVATFWAALLLGRGLTPWSLHVLRERHLYRLAMMIVVGGVCILLAAHSAGILLGGAAITGLALGPLFPITISLFMAEIGASRNAGFVFAFAGLGGAVFSWLTGVLSTSSGSLRIGLLVPAAASLSMLALMLWPRQTPGLEPR